MGPKFSQAEAPANDSHDLHLSPMLNNPNMMEMIVPYLSVQDLLALRRTCHLWNSIVIPQIRERHNTIVLNLSSESMENFVKVMKSSDGIPFSKYQLTNCRRSLKGFDAACGESATEMSVWGRSSFMFDDLLTTLLPREWFENVDDEDYKPLPNLKRFSFFVIDKSVATECSQLVVKLILSASELEDLRLRNCPWLFMDHDHQSYHAFIDSVFIAIRDFNTNVHKLKRLQIGPVNRPILQLLLQLTDEDRGENVLRLEYFVITVTGSGWEDEDDPDRQRHEMNLLLKEFLITQASTLKELTIIIRETILGRRVNSTIPIMLPQLERLETLKITHRYPDFVTDNQLDRRSIDFNFVNEKETFASLFPALTKLEYPLKSRILDPANAELIDISHPGINDLTVEVCLPHLALLPTRFPSVTHLQLRLDISNTFANNEESQDALSRVWTMWPELTHLKLDVELFSGAGAVRSDEFVTGVRRDQMPDLRQELDAFTSLITAEHPLTLDRYGWTQCIGSQVQDQTWHK